MSRTLKVMGNRVMYNRGAWFLRVIMLSSRDLCCLLSAKKQKYDFHFLFIQCTCTIKQLLDSVFVISRIIKVSVRVMSLSLWLFWISQKPHPIINCLLFNVVFSFPISASLPIKWTSFSIEQMIWSSLHPKKLPGSHHILHSILGIVNLSWDMTSQLKRYCSSSVNEN